MQSLGLFRVKSMPWILVWFLVFANVAILVVLVRFRSSLGSGLVDIFEFLRRKKS